MMTIHSQSGADLTWDASSGCLWLRAGGKQLPLDRSPVEGYAFYGALVTMVTATGPELEFIRANFQGIPDRDNAEIVHYYGDDARFILGNL